MIRRTSLTALMSAVALVAGLGASATAYAQQVTLRVFSGGANQRPDLMRKLFDQYQAKNPNVKVEIETGGATSELQRQYLSTVLNAKDSAIDIYLIDIVNPAQYYGAGWLEPLDAYLGKPADVLKPYLPVYSSSNVVDGKIAAMPAFADAMFMYYRKDLLDKHGVKEPKTWDELSAAAAKIQKAEGNPNLQGLSIQGAPIEGAVCTFLLPYWGQGKDFNDAAGKMTLDKDAATKGLATWLSMVDAGDGRRQERHLRRRLAMGGQRVQQEQGGCGQPRQAPVQPRVEQVPGCRRLAAAGLPERLHRCRCQQDDAVVQGCRQRRHRRQEPPDEQGLWAGQRRDPHDDQCGAGAHQDAG